MPNPEHGGPRPLRLSVRNLVLVLVLATGSFGCAYYNTFFLARKYFNQALLEEKRNTTGKLSPAAASAYEKAIKQCSKVLQRYDNSKWNDDALFLMGRAYFGREEYAQARRWLDELATTQPKSPLVADARYWEGRSWLAEDDYDKAGEAFQQILDKYPEYKHRDEVQFYLAEVDSKQERFAEAIEKYDVIVKRYPKSPLVIDAQIRIGDAQFSQKKYDLAQASWERAMNGTRDPKQRFETRLKAGQAMEKQDRFAEALQTYRAMADELVPRDRLSRILSGGDATGSPGATPGQVAQNPPAADPYGNSYDPNGDPNNPPLNPDNYNFSGTANTPNASGTYAQQPNPANYGQNPSGYGQNPNNPNFNPQGNANSRLAVSAAVQANPMASELPHVLLREGMSLSEMGQNEDAMKIFRAITAAYPRTSEAAEAQYRIGYIQEVYLEDYEAARISYDAARQQGVSTFSDEARRRADGLARLVALQAADSLKTKEGTDAATAAAEKDFLAAELYYFQQDKTDKALEQYAAVEQNYPTSEFAAKAALARAWILSFAQGDTAAGRAAYLHVEKTYPGSDQAKVAHQVLTGEVPEPETPSSAEAGPPPALADALSDSLGAPEPAKAPPPSSSSPPPASPAVSDPVVQVPPPAQAGPPARTPEQPPVVTSTKAPEQPVTTSPVIPAPAPVTPAPPASAPSTAVPPAKTEMPTTKTEVPPAKTEVPPTKIEVPTTKTDAPPATTEVPPAKIEVPTTKTEAPPAMTEPSPNPTALLVTARPDSARVVSGTLTAPAPPISLSRLAPAGTAGLPRPLSLKNPAPPRTAAVRERQKATKQSKPPKPKRTKSYGIGQRGAARPPADNAPADTVGVRAPQR